MKRVAREALRLAGALLASFLLPADCLLCGRPLPWRQRGGVCLPCWEGLPWASGARSRRGRLDALVWAADYQGPIRDLIHGLKFADWDVLGRPLGEAVASRLGPLLRERPDLVVPVPLHFWRRYRRGYNQAALLARAIASRLGLRIDARALRRRRAGRRQLGLSRRERLLSLAGCFAARPERVRGRTILLVDDVVTTGATLQACARELRRAGARRVVACVVARTPRRA